MKNKHDQGFSLVEILVAIVILAAFVVPTCSALVLTAKMNEKTDDMMKAQLAVSSAVETLMAQGIPWDYQGEDLLGEEFAETGICVQIVKPAGTEALADGEAEEPPAIPSARAHARVGGVELVEGASRQR